MPALAAETREALNRYRDTLDEGYQQESFSRGTPYSRLQAALSAGFITQEQFDAACKAEGDFLHYTGD